MSSFTPSAPLRTAVLLVVFNRPDTTRHVFETIRKAQPPRLYIAADAPRTTHPDDAVACRQVREIATQVDWPCQLHTLFHSRNLGCGKGPATAYNWFFSQEEEGIILEDDCVPDLSFFWFCEELLTVYRNDCRVMHIAGTNFLGSRPRSPQYSYFFSCNPHEWGWASWRRAWQLYDYQIRHYPEVRSKGSLRHHYSGWLEYQYRMSKFRNTYDNPTVNWWDYQWNFTLHINEGLAIVPQVNLVRNIGFGPGATHTVSTRDVRGKNTARQMAFPLKHPPTVVQDKVADQKYFYVLMQRLFLRKLLSFFRVKGYDSRG